jgi:hypothetical protein
MKMWRFEFVRLVEVAKYICQRTGGPGDSNELKLNEAI